MARGKRKQRRGRAAIVEKEFEQSKETEESVEKLAEEGKGEIEEKLVENQDKVEEAIDNVVSKTPSPTSASSFPQKSSSPQQSPSKPSSPQKPSSKPPSPQKPPSPSSPPQKSPSPSPSPHKPPSQPSSPSQKASLPPEKSVREDTDMDLRILSATSSVKPSLARTKRSTRSSTKASLPAERKLEEEVIVEEEEEVEEKTAREKKGEVEEEIETEKVEEEEKEKKSKRVKQVARKGKVSAAEKPPVIQPSEQKKRKASNSPAAVLTKKKGKTTQQPLYDLGGRIVFHGFVCPSSWLDQTFLSDFKAALDFQGWSELFARPIDVFEHLVEDFYSFLQANDDGEVGSTVEGVEIRLSRRRMGKILGVPKEGFCEYSKENWPTIPNVTPDQIQNRLFTGPSAEKQGYVISQLKEPVMRLFHTVASKIVLPRAQGRMDVRIMDAVIIFCLIERIKLSLPGLVLSHMVHCIERPKHSLPYGGWLTLVFQKKGVTLGGEFKRMSVLTNQILGQKGISFEDGVLRMKKDQGSSSVKKGISSGTDEATVALSQQVSAQTEMLQQMMASATALCSTLEGSFKKITERLDSHEEKLASFSRSKLKNIQQSSAAADPQEESDDDEDTDSDTF